MPKANPAARKSAKTPAEPKFVSVGLPHVPPLYSLEKRKEYLPWKHAEERLARSRNYWICTSRPDGRAHSIPVWGFWMDHALFFGTARTTTKAKNIAVNPVISVHLESGDDVVILEGRVTEVSVEDAELLKRMDAASRAKYKMPLMIMPESIIYRMRPRVVLAWSEKGFPKDATRWELAPHD